MRLPSFSLRSAPAVLALFLTAPLPAVSSEREPGGSPVGSWQPRAYALAGGQELPVDGRIIFLARDDDGDSGEWTVVFFVTDDEGNPLRGSAEGGAWFRDGASLLLTHTIHLSAGESVASLPESPLSMELRSREEAYRNHREPCEFEVSGDRLTLFFPSGNSMRFARVKDLSFQEPGQR